jgi:TIR domain-containing protein
MPSDRISAYLSHSYRHEDRKLNEFFWNIVWHSGITFAVDPQSESLSVPYLELMMKRSAAFIGIVPRRPRQEHYQCSPFMIFEHGLAVQAQKPRLLLVESGIPKYFFPDGASVLYFSRQALPDVKAEAERRVRLLARQSDPAASALGHGLGKAGIMVSRRSAARAEIQELVRAYGFSPVDVNLSVTDAFRFALELDDLDFVVLDMSAAYVPPWFYPFISGRFIPTIKLRHTAAHRSAPLAQPPWETDALLHQIALPGELGVSYRTREELKTGIAAHLRRLREERIQFRSLGEGSRYFRSLGRGQGSVFISNADEANETGRQLSTAFRQQNIQHFQYRFGNDIKLTGFWDSELPEKIRSSQYFLPLLTAGYWESEYCRDEYELARKQADAGLLKIIPYFLSAAQSVKATVIPEQGRDLSDLTLRRQVSQIVTDIDSMLEQAQPA